MVVVLMGVSGSGKTTIGRMLAAELKWEFHDGDALHSIENRQKMARGIALTDADRMPWLYRVRELIEDCIAQGNNAVIACSALKQSYRDILVADPAQVRLVYLKGSLRLIAKRISARKGHFMPPSLLPSQFAALEEPRDALAIDIAAPPAEIVRKIRKELSI